MAGDSEGSFGQHGWWRPLQRGDWYVRCDSNEREAARWSFVEGEWQVQRHWGGDDLRGTGRREYSRTAACDRERAWGVACSPWSQPLNPQSQVSTSSGLRYPQDVSCHQEQICPVTPLTARLEGSLWVVGIFRIPHHQPGECPPLFRE